jgi:K+-sensing histidine kinase KdpD
VPSVHSGSCTDHDIDGRIHAISSSLAKFVRVPGTGKRGSGLGLNIVRDVVAAHGGTIGIEDAPLGGARVWFVLPRAHGAAVSG